MDGFGVSFSAMKNEAGIVHVDEGGNETPKHLHDVRGTFCTMLPPDMRGSIRRVHVDHLRVVVALGERIAATRFAKRTGGGAGN